ncbi:hypothetical protein GF357_00135 [Candidatus Dojkabacteria bacterium]|nr:hypothetical protein [Candidatus Dojkabacteria bacterium]
MRQITESLTAAKFKSGHLSHETKFTLSLNRAKLHSNKDIGIDISAS